MSLAVIPLPEAFGGSLPEGSYVRIETLPGRNLVWERGELEGEVTVPLDPGRYIGVVKVELDEKGKTCMKEIFEFYHELTEEQWEHFQSMHPRAAVSRMTSDGCKWFCRMGFPQPCKKKTTSEVEMIFHEFEHLGMSRDKVLSIRNPALELKRRADAFTAQKQAAERTDRDKISGIKTNKV